LLVDLTHPGRGVGEQGSAPLTALVGTVEAPALSADGLPPSGTSLSSIITVPSSLPSALASQEGEMTMAAALTTAASVAVAPASTPATAVTTTAAAADQGPLRPPDLATLQEHAELAELRAHVLTRAIHEALAAPPPAPPPPAETTAVLGTTASTSGEGSSPTSATDALSSPGAAAAPPTVDPEWAFLLDVRTRDGHRQSETERARNVKTETQTGRQRERDVRADSGGRFVGGSGCCTSVASRKWCWHRRFLSRCRQACGVRLYGPSFSMAAHTDTDFVCAFFFGGGGL
jgi:hypothetical protein